MEFNPRNVRHNIGDKVVALSSNNKYHCQNRQAGKIYTVLDTIYCIKCGIQSINIGQYTSNELVECLCGGVQHAEGKRWTDSHFFAPLQEIDNMMASAIEEENYEIAQILKEINP